MSCARVCVCVCVCRCVCVCVQVCVGAGKLRASLVGCTCRRHENLLQIEHEVELFIRCKLERICAHPVHSCCHGLAAVVCAFAVEAGTGIPHVCYVSGSRECCRHGHTARVLCKRAERMFSVGQWGNAGRYLNELGVDIASAGSQRKPTAPESTQQGRHPTRRPAWYKATAHQ